MNERGVGIAESTCGGRTVGWAAGAYDGRGKNLFGIDELTRVALER